MKRDSGTKVNAVAIAVAALGFCAAAQDWPGFQGIDRHGVLISATPPVNWAKEHNVKWRTPLPGKGYSSPVVFGDSVYVTTAYDSDKGGAIRQMANYVMLVLSCLLSVGGFASVVGVLAHSLSGVRAVIQNARAFLLMALVLLVVECAFFAEGLFHLGESAHRSWKMATVITAASLFMIPLLITPRPGRWYLFAAVSSLFAAIAYFCMPRRELFLDFSNSDGIVSTGLVLLPAFLAWAWVLLVSRKKASGGERGFHAKIRAATLSTRVAVCCGVPMALLAGALWALAQRAATHSNVQLPPSLGWAGLGVVTASCFVGLVVGTIFWLLESSEPFRWMTKGAVLIALAVGSLFFIQNGYLPAQKKTVWAVISINRQAGSVQWIREVASGADLRELNLKGNSLASSTPVIIGDRICSYFGSRGLVCLDHRGHELWRSQESIFESTYGDGTSPIARNGVLVVANENERLANKGQGVKPNIVAFNVSDGTLIWRHDRPFSEIGYAGYATPMLRDVGGRVNVLVRGWEDITAYDLMSGDIRWAYRLKHRGDHLVASLVFDDNRLYVTDAEEVVALDLDAIEAGREPVLWSTPLSGEKIATPVVVDGLLFAVSESGSAACLDANTGKLEWEHEFPGLFFASLVAFGKNVMFTSESGDAWLVNCSRRFLLAARNSFGEKIYATPVPQKDAILIRTIGNLYCVAAGIDRPRL